MEMVTLTPIVGSNKKIVVFSANRLLFKATHTYETPEDTKKSPLAQHLFSFPFVKQVSFNANMIAVQCADFITTAEDIQKELKNELEHFINSGVSLMEMELEHPPEAAITIYLERTPNPETMKFVFNQNLSKQDFEFKDKREAKGLPFLEYIFEDSYVKEVFIRENFITITRSNNQDWSLHTDRLKKSLHTVISEHIETIEATLQEYTGPLTILPLTEEERQICQILDEYIKPAVAGDGGNIEFKAYDPNTKVLTVLLKGACSGCPSSIITLKDGIEYLLREKIPGVVEKVKAL